MSEDEHRDRRAPKEEPGAETARAPAVEAGELVRRLIDSDTADDEESRGRLLGRLSLRLMQSARTAGAKSAAGGRWLADVFAENIAPQITIGDREALRSRHRGPHGRELGDEELADALVRAAARRTAAVGAAGGTLAAAKFHAPPLWLTAPALITAETVLVASIEVRLIGELHEVYGTPAPGGPVQRTTSYVSSWIYRRGLDTESLAESAGVALNTAAKTALRNRLLRLMGRNLSTLGPYLTGAVAGGTLNHTGTRTLAKAVRADLRRRALPGRPGTADTALPPGA